MRERRTAIAARVKEILEGLDQETGMTREGSHQETDNNSSPKASLR
jgi:hypothetical protein